MGQMWMRDLRLVIRGFRRGPFAALGAAAMLSSGLVALLLTAGLANTLLFRQVSATHGDALRRIAAIDRQGRSSLRLSYIDLQLIRQHVDAAGVVTLVNMQPVVIRVERDSTQTMVEVVDGQYFAVTGTEVVIGRTLVAPDDQPGSDATVVISESFWRRRFGSSPTAMGKVIHLNGQPFAIVGVSRALGSSSFLGASVDAWVTTAHADPLLTRGWRTDVTNRWFTGFVLSRTTESEIESRLKAATADLVWQHSEAWRERRLQTADATVVTGSQRETVTMLARILGGLGLLILATAASNVGGVLLARATATRRQAAIHLAVGSGRAAIVRRQLMEGAILGVAGGIAAVALYVWIRNSVAEIALLPTLGLRLELPLNGALVVTTLMGGACAGFLLAIGPALWASRVELAEAMRGSEIRTSGGRGLTRMRRLLVSTQVGLSLVLIVGAALFTRSLEALIDTDLGFARDRLVAMDFDIEPSGPSTSELPALGREALRRAQTTHGVVSAAMSNRAPVDASTPMVQVSADRGGASARDVSMYLATAGYFETVGIPIVAGRAFTEAESEMTAAVVIVNETLAAQLWPAGDALDRLLYITKEGSAARVIGVARNSKYRSISEASRPHVYRPTPPALGLTLLARTSAHPRQTLSALQNTLDRVGPGLVGFFPRTLDDHLASELLPTRAAATAATALGALALPLSAVGLYGLVSWFVELRRREIGVRMALGASAREIRILVVRQALSTAIPGMFVGLVMAGVLATLARAALFGVGPLDPSALAVGVVSLTIVVIAAAYGPTRRATRIDPAKTLRT